MTGGEFGKYGKVLRFNSSFRKNPTVTWYPNFHPQSDAEKIQEAIANGKDKDIDVIIDILTTRTADQRAQVREVFDAQNEKNLHDSLQKKLSGDVETLALALVDPPMIYDAKLLQKAMSGLGTDETTLIDVICPKTNQEIRYLKEMFQQLTGKDLEKQVGSETSGNFKKLLLNILKAERDESTMVDTAMAEQDAEILVKDKKADEHFAETMAFQNVFQLQQMSYEYKVKKQEKIQEGLSSKFSGDFSKACLAIIQCCMNKEAYFAEALYNSMKGLGTKEARLNWVVVTRADIDLLNVKMEFEKNYKESLDKMVEGDTSGKYREALRVLIKSRIEDKKNEE